MEWEKDAVESFVKMPVADVMKETAKIFSEKLARRSGSNRITMEEIIKMKKSEGAFHSEDLFQKVLYPCRLLRSRR